MSIGMKKFQLSRETLRKLTSDEMRSARGGVDKPPGTSGGGDISHVKDQNTICQDTGGHITVRGADDDPHACD